MKLEEEIKQVKFRSEQQKAVLNILFTASWIENLQKEFFEPFGITGHQYNILRILRGQHPNRICAYELKSRMLDKSSDISRLLDRLIGKKLVIKSISKQDKRASEIRITPQGLALLQKLDSVINLLDMEVMKLSSADAKKLNLLLESCRN
ncbi:MAG TPA: MarR family transcriptional regulator [Cyclobacteriaceae bacterium]|jgi:DNA-binding MarR family transcriptional regulator|nr:MarR family transcriptional regulator [Cytophagales bacterium]HRE66430.1 MarR family transcriptional regulator [Cyclobacteriaceae bacterium]HRF32037.1 MarR family transcriptional regulator [Cyclobacteriaceae bacterium]